MGITYDGLFAKAGWMLEKKSVAAEVTKKIKETMPEIVWLAPAVRGDPPPDAEDVPPGVRRNRQRAQRRSLEVANELAKGACEQIREGRHCAWEVPLNLRYWKGCRAEQALAVTSGRLPALAPTGKKLKEIQENMLRLHRAAGHTSFENLARLLQRRGCPDWAVQVARGLQCDDCTEVRRQAGPPAASAEPPPCLWEVLGMDVMEVEYKKGSESYKAKVLLMIDRASRFVMTHVLHEYEASQSWEPSTLDIKRAIVKTWLHANPSPRWLMTDAAPYFTSREMVDFVSRSGLGLMTAPAEAHYLMGIEARAIQTIKRALEKLHREDLGLGLEALCSLACHGHNSFVHSATGYSPFQWTRGWQRENALPVGLDPQRAFGKLLLYRAKAEEAFAQADAATKLSKLSNSIGRPVAQYKAGDLCMLWRARVNKQRGGWTGPLRVLLQESTTLWLATGTTLVRAKLNQVRPCSEREQLVTSTQGTTIYKQAVGLEILLRGYRGKHFLDPQARQSSAVSLCSYQGLSGPRGATNRPEEDSGTATGRGPNHQ